MADDKKTVEVTKPTVARVMLRIALIPKLRKIVRDILGPSYHNVPPQALRWLVVSTLSASPYRTLLDNYLHAAGLSYADIANRL